MIIMKAIIKPTPTKDRDKHDVSIITESVIQYTTVLFTVSNKLYYQIYFTWIYRMELIT